MVGPLIRGLEQLRQLSPIWRDLATYLFDELRRAGLRGRVYDVYRSPAEQERRFALGDTRARAGQSPHQYGLAFDFVVSEGERSPQQRALQQWWREIGLGTISWDPAHVEVPNWRAWL